MKKGKIIFIIYFLLLYSILSSHAQSAEPSFQQIFNEYIENSEGPGYAALVSKGGEVIYESANGMADLESGIALSKDHIFRIGSITKQFTAAAILLLEEEGKLSVLDDMKKYIPEYPVEEGKITIEHLLTHTSGIKSYTSMGPAFQEMMRVDMSPSEIIDVFKNEPLDFQPWRRISL